MISEEKAKALLKIISDYNKEHGIDLSDLETSRTNVPDEELKRRLMEKMDEL